MEALSKSESEMDYLQSKSPGLGSPDHINLNIKQENDSLHVDASDLAQLSSAKSCASSRPDIRMEENESLDDSDLKQPSSEKVYTSSEPDIKMEVYTEEPDKDNTGDLMWQTWNVVRTGEQNVMVPRFLHGSLKTGYTKMESQHVRWEESSSKYNAQSVEGYVYEVENQKCKEIPSSTTYPESCSGMDDCQTYKRDIAKKSDSVMQRNSQYSPNADENIRKDMTACEKEIGGEMFTQQAVDPNRASTGKQDCSCTTCLLIHYRIYTDEELPECQTDGERHPSSYQPSGQCMIDAGEKSVKCEVCGKTISSLRNLRIHERIHTGVKPFECNICGKRFTQSSSLKIHNILHTGMKPYKCKICNKGFTNPSYVKIHTRTHAVDKPFKCSACGKGFIRNANLGVHIRAAHSSVKPYECQICSKRFTQLHSLKEHGTAHTGVKPYKCQTCGDAFARPAYLWAHNRRHTGEKPYECLICGKRFPFSSALSVHCRTHAGEKAL